MNRNTDPVEPTKPAACNRMANSPTGVTLPPIDATPEEIAKALFRVKPEGETTETAGD